MYSAKHLLTHPNNKVPNICSMYDFVFSSSSQLTAHYLHRALESINKLPAGPFLAVEEAARGVRCQLKFKRLLSIQCSTPDTAVSSNWPVTRLYLSQQQTGRAQLLTPTHTLLGVAKNVNKSHMWSRILRADISFCVKLIQLSCQGWVGGSLQLRPRDKTVIFSGKPAVFKAEGHVLC